MVHFGTHMLEKEAKDLWGNTRHIFYEEGTEVTWAIFREAFMEKYFPEDIHGNKEVELIY